MELASEKNHTLPVHHIRSLDSDTAEDMEEVEMHALAEAETRCSMPPSVDTNGTTMTSAELPGWTDLHDCAVRGTKLDCLNLIENGADGMAKVNSDVVPDELSLNLHVPSSTLLTPMELASYSENLDVLEILALNTEDDIIQKCLANATVTTKPYIVKGMLRKEYKGKYIEIVFGRLNGTREEMIVVYTQKLMHGAEIKKEDFRVVFRDPTRSNEEEKDAMFFAHIEGIRLTKQELNQVNRAIEMESDKLWKKHSNIKGICPSSVKSECGECHPMPCMLILCHFKSFIPDKEEEFPTTIEVDGQGIPVDVREGHFDLHLLECPTAHHDNLSIGCSISTDDGTTRCGTIGPFVQLGEHEVGFLTCAHVLCNTYDHIQDGKVPVISVYQPENGDLDLSSEQRLCGEVIDMKFRVEGRTFIDAALVRITQTRVPTAGTFAAALYQSQLTDAGFPETIFPKFDDGQTSYDPEIGSKVIKLGRSSGLTYGTLDRTDVQISNVLYGKTRLVWTGLYYIQNIQCREAGCRKNAFSEPGDSGAAVFHQREDNSLTCIGILIGAEKTTGAGLVIPIRPILQSFELDSLKHFP